ncbi:MAG: hypothetical protein JWN90_678 [Parcubacteria group bacterium]|nr:hypothetical protein [Parcubacteria group bacterium]
MTATPDFVTSDGTMWATDVCFMEKVTPERLKVFTYHLLFPKADDVAAENGTVSDQHIALYVEGDIVPSEQRIIDLLKTLNQLLEWDLSNFYLRY